MLAQVGDLLVFGIAFSCLSCGDVRDVRLSIAVHLCSRVLYCFYCFIVSIVF